MVFRESSPDSASSGERLVEIPLSPEDVQARPGLMGGTGDEGDDDWITTGDGLGGGAKVFPSKQPPTKTPRNTRLIVDEKSFLVDSKAKRWGQTETRCRPIIFDSKHFAPTASDDELEHAEDTGDLLGGDWVDDEEAFEQVKKLDPACLGQPEPTGVQEVVACAVAIAAELEEKSRLPRRTALNLLRDGIVSGAQTVHDGAELVVDSLIQLPWGDAASTLYEGTIDTASRLGKAGKSIARAVAATPLAKRAARAVDELVTGAGISTMGAARDVLDAVQTKLAGTVADLDNRMVNMENRLNPPNLWGQFVKVGDDDEEEAILVSKRNPAAKIRRPRKKSRDVLGSDDEEEGDDDPVDDDEALE